MAPCEEHGKIIEVLHRIDAALPLQQKDMEYMRRDLETVLARFAKHVEDAEKQGGRHERLKNVEDIIEALEERVSADKLALESKIAVEKKNLEDKVATEKSALEMQMRNDRIMGRWFMIGTGIISGGVVTGSIKIWAVISKTLGV